jgi:hypothetical protein
MLEITDNIVPFATVAWFCQLGLLVFGRGMDFLSTWVATPHLVLEGNPIAKKLGWKWGIALNAAACLALAFVTFLSVSVTTMSLLVAAHNFQQAWLMRLLGEEAYRDWQVARLQDTPVGIFLLCLLGQVVLVGLIGVALVLLTEAETEVFAIGCGILIYVGALSFYTLLAFWRIRRARA